MYKRVSKACECAPYTPDEFQRSFFPQGGKTLGKLYSYYKNTKTELNDCPYTFFDNPTTDLSSSQYVNEQTLFFSHSTGSSSIWWPFCAEVVSN